MRRGEGQWVWEPLVMGAVPQPLGLEEGSRGSMSDHPLPPLNRVPKHHGQPPLKSP